MKTLMTLALCAFTSGAMAFGGLGGNATQGQAQSVRQGNRQSSRQSNSYNNEAASYDRLAMPAYAPSVQPTVHCFKPYNGGLTIPGVGSLSGGAGEIDEGCVMRETVRIGLTSNDPAVISTANEVLLHSLKTMLPEAVEPAPRADTADADSFDWSQLGG